MPIENYIHPFVDSLSDKIVENLVEGSEWIDFLISHLDTKIKGIEYIGSAIEYYKKSQLHLDQPMRELLSSNEELQRRMDRSHSFLV